MLAIADAAIIAIFFARWAAAHGADAGDLIGLFGGGLGAAIGAWLAVRGAIRVEATKKAEDRIEKILALQSAIGWGKECAQRLVSEPPETFKGTLAIFRGSIKTVDKVDGMTSLIDWKHMENISALKDAHSKLGRSFDMILETQSWANAERRLFIEQASEVYIRCLDNISRRLTEMMDVRA